MPETPVVSAPSPSSEDVQFLRRAGIHSDLTPGLSHGRLWLLAVAAALAGGTALFGGVAQLGAPTAVLSDCATQCPMGGDTPAKPAP